MGKKRTQFAAGTLCPKGRPGPGSGRHHESIGILGMGWKCLETEKTGVQKGSERILKIAFSQGTVWLMIAFSF